jgi:ketosteroid isomerase-like protein
MEEQRNRELVREVYEASFAGDMSVFNGAVREDFEAHVAPALPWGGVYLGRETFIANVLPALAAAVDFSTMRVTSISADGDDVVAVVSGRAAGGDELWIAENWTLRGGKIGRLRVFYYDARPFASSPTAAASQAA